MPTWQLWLVPEWLIMPGTHCCRRFSDSITNGAGSA
jgi:hypothetical protein